MKNLQQFLFYKFLNTVSFIFNIYRRHGPQMLIEKNKKTLPQLYPKLSLIIQGSVSMSILYIDQQNIQEDSCPVRRTKDKHVMDIMLEIFIFYQGLKSSNKTFLPYYNSQDTFPTHYY